jgi:hypothetical protein
MKLLVAGLACVAVGAVIWALQENKDKNKILSAFAENVTSSHKYKGYAR